MSDLLARWQRQSHVSQRLIATTTLFLLTIFGILFFTISTIQDQKFDSIIVDLAGRQRMLNQQYMREILLFSQGEKADLSSTQTILLNTVDALMNGGSAVVHLETGQTVLLPSAPTDEIFQKLQEQQSLINQFIMKADVFLQDSSGGTKGEGALPALLELNKKVHRVANEVVKLFDEHSASKINWMIKWEIFVGLIVGVFGVVLTRQIRQSNRELEKEIAERTRSENSLKDSEERYSRILETAMDAILSIDHHDQIVLFNQAAENMFGLPMDQAVGRRFSEFLSSQSVQLFRTYVTELHMSDRPQAFIGEQDGFRAYRMNGDEFPVEVSLSEIMIAGHPLITVILRDINERYRMESELAKTQLQKLYLQDQLREDHLFEEIVGVSPQLKMIFDQVKKVAQTDASVLVTGETGTGKELVARAIHNLSHRKDQVLIKVNCAGLPEGLVESELFGHEKGAFTGATMKMKGRFELADGGTVFLDEVGELPLQTQSKLLRVLQERQFERLGGTQTISVDVRIIAATNRHLEEAVQLGAFRSDLKYRLNTFPIHIPPLRDRREDIPLLTRYFIEKLSKRMGKRIDGLNQAALGQLLNYHWPGNVRELTNILERAMILCDGGVLQPHHISLSPSIQFDERDFPTLEEVERSHIVKALKKTSGLVGGNHGAATLLKLNRSTLLSRMRKLGIKNNQKTQQTSDDISPLRRNINKSGAHP